MINFEPKILLASVYTLYKIRADETCHFFERIHLNLLDFIYFFHKYTETFGMISIVKGVRLKSIKVGKEHSVAAENDSKR